MHARIIIISGDLLSTAATTTSAAASPIASLYVECHSGNIIIIFVRKLCVASAKSACFKFNKYIETNVNQIPVSCWMSTFQVSNSKIRSTSSTKNALIFTFRFVCFFPLNFWVFLFFFLNSKSDWKRHTQQHLIIYSRLPDVYAYVLCRKIVDISMHLRHFNGWIINYCYAVYARNERRRAE